MVHCAICCLYSERSERRKDEAISRKKAVYVEAMSQASEREEETGGCLTACLPTCLGNFCCHTRAAQ